MSHLRILWISAGRAVLEDFEGTRLDVLLEELASDEKMIAKLAPIDAFRLGYQAALFQGKGAGQSGP
jgi:hypothetical protein